MKKWAQYFSTPPAQRKKTLNVISLEFSHTPLRKCITAPEIVQSVDWITNYWFVLRFLFLFPRRSLICGSDSVTERLGVPLCFFFDWLTCRPEKRYTDDGPVVIPEKPAPRRKRSAPNLSATTMTTTPQTTATTTTTASTTSTSATTGATTTASTELPTVAAPGTPVGPAPFPKVQFYFLSGVKGCYTDFHIDFGGSSVWYNVMSGMLSLFRQGTCSCPYRRKRILPNWAYATQRSSLRRMDIG